MTLPTLSVVVVTYERPEYLLRCLRSLEVELDCLLDIVVVDASAKSNDLTVSGMPKVAYVHTPDLAGWMTRSRNRALLYARGDVIAFLDDDVVVRPGWADALRSAFETTGASAVVGRTRNGEPGEEAYPLPIGRLLANGRLTEGFASEVGKWRPVDHGIGANMSFTRAVLEQLGGFRDDYPGTALREDTDIFLRVKQLGKLSIFCPAAVVDHMPAPHVRGRRFDARYKLYGRRNHLVLLARYAGARSSMFRQYIVAEVRSIPAAGGLRRRVERLGVTILGLTFGLSVVCKQRQWGPLDPLRHGESADSLRKVLGTAPPSSSSGSQVQLKEGNDGVE